jgi:hypothetical protein
VFGESADEEWKNAHLQLDLYLVLKVVPAPALAPVRIVWIEIGIQQTPHWQPSLCACWASVVGANFPNQMNAVYCLSLIPSKAFVRLLSLSSRAAGSAYSLSTHLLPYPQSVLSPGSGIQLHSFIFSLACHTFFSWYQFCAFHYIHKFDLNCHPALCEQRLLCYFPSLFPSSSCYQPYLSLNHFILD